ncbi:type I restriction endonuclease subunit R [Corynebacterium hylobatis]|uniref:Type I restriction endonuclease subunit R n=1 Tax=Corynebacterium hylobatis TaxID=1859290 RepID=A0A3S0HF34_9CORY|nr:type I restriction endonuclease [Corynebacterium hylobatis]RSZ61247.1 type I restriction endonuclease subunit R [Corynebacterium hylobatis]
MSVGAHREVNLQRFVVDHLASHGWLASKGNEGYDKERALFVPDLLGWLEETDPDNYHRIVPKDAPEAAVVKGRNRILDRVAKKLSAEEKHGGGTLNVLRNGVDVVGAKKFSLLQMPPANDKNPRLTERYEQNRLRVVEELVYSTRHRNRLDLALFVNGIPVATVEIKTEFTQSLAQAEEQYSTQRPPEGEPLLTAGRGALVHFAVTDRRISMTTLLAGPKTEFLPFNQGHDGGAGNPPSTRGHATSYFWEDILDRDTWLTILTKFIYTNHQAKTDPITGKITTTSQIRFPRFHQWRAVSKIAAAAAVEGPGHNYLIQHSAGSGKTDSIAWTAHRLASLHNHEGEKVFDTVFVIADRQVLDRQLQDAVRQLESVPGTFQAIDSGGEGSKTARLTQVLTSGTAKIVGVTLQTFPYALAALKDPANQDQLKGRTFAIIADEAHSSQTGGSAKAVREMLYLTQDTTEFDLEEPGADQDALVAMAAHSDAEKRLSYFAFTATPKAKTLELFGRRNPATQELEPFDLYPMKQAIEEGFILDVLKNYTTYDMAARVALKGTTPAATAGEQPQPTTPAEAAEGEVDVRQGTRAYINFVELHPTNVASKVDVILDHYRSTVQPHLGGRAKAMVVTESRAAAVRYARAFEKAIEARNLPLQTLVAFSGEVPDPDVASLPGTPPKMVTEASMNPILKGRDLASVFAQDGQNILVVANKYQTGFDQRLLVGMYVDKQLSGIAAVQTLSRLNRKADGKSDTYVLDFVNDPEQILESFQMYYEAAYIETESDPDLVADLIAKLEAQHIFTWAEVDQVWAAWSAQHTTAARKHSQFSGYLAPALERFSNAWEQTILTHDDERREELLDFKAVLSQYVKAYSFFSQILHFGDPRYEKMSVFADLLAKSLREFTAEAEKPEVVDVSDVVLTHFRLEKIREDDLGLSTTAGDVPGLKGMTEAGLAKARESEHARKAELVEKVNKYFGDLEAKDEYKVNFVQTLLAEAADSPELSVQAKNNSKIDFASSPQLQVVLEDALWQHEESSNEVLKAAREMTTLKLVEMVMEFGLFERLRDEDTG